jgi:hypothetical protein
MHFYYHVSNFFFENAIFSNVLSFFLSLHLHLYFLLFANLFGFQTFPNLVFQALAHGKMGGEVQHPNKQTTTS